MTITNLEEFRDAVNQLLDYNWQNELRDYMRCRHMEDQENGIFPLMVEIQQFIDPNSSSATLQEIVADYTGSNYSKEKEREDLITHVAQCTLEPSLVLAEQLMARMPLDELRKFARTFQKAEE